MTCPITGRRFTLAWQIRAKKQKKLTLPELRAAWDAQLADGDALAAVYHRDVPPNGQVTAAESVAYSLHHCLERESCLPEREVKRVALLYGLGHVTPEEIAAELPCHGVVTAEFNGRLTSTTREAHGKELLLPASAGRGVVQPVSVSADLERGKLDDEQWAAVTGLLTSHDKVRLVDSAADVGKTTALTVFDQGMELAGSQVTYLAATGKAVDVPQKDAFAAETLARFLLPEKMQDAARNSHVVIDESSMLGHAVAYKLFRIAKNNNITLTFLWIPARIPV